MLLKHAVGRVASSHEHVRAWVRATAPVVMTMSR